jgi:glycosyltransferase involved in cell wall biosynthesis
VSSKGYVACGGKDVKLAFLTPEFLPHLGGVGIYSINLVKELSKYEDVDIHVFTPVRGNDYDSESVLDYFGHRIKLHNICVAHDDFVYNLAFQCQVFLQLQKYHQQYEYDLIHAANLVNMPDVFLKLRSLSVPTITTVHTTIKGQVQGFLRISKNPFALAHSEKCSLAAYPLISLLERVYISKSKYFIAVSHKSAEMMRQDYHFEGVIEPIHNGIDLELYDYERIGDPYQKFPELKGKGPIVLYAGRLIAQKGLNLFAEAISHLKETDAHFVFAGRGSHHLLFHILQRHRISKERYTYLGFVPGDVLPSVYKLSSVFVLPSFYENFPFSLLEAMAMKVPCVASDVGAIDEIIDDGKTGLLFPVGDSERLASHISALLQDEPKRWQIGEAGYKRVVTEFTSTRMAEKHRQFYQRVLSGGYKI